MKTYRYSGHSRSDPANYRPPGELERWLKRDPIELFAERLVEQGQAARDDLESVASEARTNVDETVEAVLAAPRPGVADMFQKHLRIRGRAAMRREVPVPQLGDMAESVLILTWHVAPGDAVEVGDVLAEVETDKARADIESPLTGVLVELLAEADSEVAVGAPLCVIDG